MGDTERGFSKNIATDRAMNQDIREDFQLDPQMYHRLGNRETLQKAQDIFNRGFDQARIALDNALSAAQRGQKLPPEMVPLSRLVANRLASEGDLFSARNLLSSVAIELTQAGQLGQAGAILRDADPATKVMLVEKLADRANRSADKSERGGVRQEDTTGITDVVSGERVEAAREISGLLDEFSRRLSSVERQKNDAEHLIREIYEAFSEGRDKQAQGETSWVYQLAQDLARNAANRASDKGRTQTVYSIMLGDLSAFMRQYVATGKNTAPKRTTIDTLTDYFNNREEYAVAWNRAIEQLKKKYAKDNKMLDRLEDFLYGTMGYNATGTDAVILQAVASVALDNDLSVREMVVRDRYDTDALVNTIASDLIQRTGAAGADAQAITSAVQRYFREKSLSNKYSADEYIRRDIPSALKEIGVRLGDVLTKGAKDKQAVADQVADVLTKQYGISRAAAEGTSSAIVGQFQEMVRERSQKKLEYMFKDRNKRTKKTIQQRFDDLVNLGAFSSQFNEAAVKRLFRLDGISVDNDLITDYANAKTDADRDAALEKIYQNIADQIQSTFMDKFNALRFMNMLGNLRTVIKNLGGNVVMKEVRGVKNKVAAAIEAAVHAVSGGKYRKTTTFFLDRALYQAAKQDFQTMKAQAMGAGKTSDRSANSPIQEINDRRTIFKNSGTWGTLPSSPAAARAARKVTDALWMVPEGYRLVTNWMMNNQYFGDEAFSRTAYADSMARYLRANRVTAKQMTAGTVDPDLLNTARERAIRDAREATFRDNNQFSEMISSIGFKNPDTTAKRVANAAVQGSVPFLRTPANVMVQAEKYSPVGIVNTAVNAARLAKGSKNISGADVIDSLSKTLTGTGLFALGIMLFNQGLLTGGGGDDENQKAFDDLTGVQAYSLTLPSGESYTLDWLAPAAMPLFAGAEWAKAGEEGGHSTEEILNSVKSMSNVLLNMSMMQGINDQLSDISYAEYPLYQLVINSLAGYLTQGLSNTLLGQVERTAEDVRMSTYTDKNFTLPTDVQYTVGRMSSRTPGLDYQQIPYIDAWGREERTGTLPMRAFNNFLNPAYTSSLNVTPVDAEIQRLYNQVGDSGVVPKRPERYIETGEGDDKVRKDLSGQEYVQYATQRGQTRYAMLEELLDNPSYQGLIGTDKTAVVKDVYAYTDAVAKAEVSDYELDGWIKKAVESGVDPSAYILYRHSLSDSGITLTDRVQAMEEAGITGDAQTQLLLLDNPDWAEAAREAGVSEALFADFKVATAGISSDRDREGNTISGSKKEKVLAAIDGMGISRREKDALYYAAGYRESTIYEAPWH